MGDTKEMNEGYILGHGTLVTVDQQQRIILDGAVAVVGSTIEAIGKTDDLKTKYKNLTFHNMRNHIIMPGLINSHVHVHQALLRCLVPAISGAG
jgi:5-methylthioadenosine/S-adenosylhomocysteine deaminase